MSDRDQERCTGEAVTRSDIDEIVAEVRAALEENPYILCELLETVTAFNQSMRRMVESLEESNRRSEHTRREIDALMAEVRFDNLRALGRIAEA